MLGLAVLSMTPILLPLLQIRGVVNLTWFPGYVIYAPGLILLGGVLTMYPLYCLVEIGREKTGRQKEEGSLDPRGTELHVLEGS